MNFLNAIFSSLDRKERILIFSLIGIFVLTFVTRTVLAVQDNSVFIPVEGGEYTEGAVGQPTLINPIISNNSVDRDISELVYSTLDDLATSTISGDDNRVYTVKLKENAKWSDGEPISSDDVIFTIDTIQDPEVNSPMISAWRGVIAEKISDTKVRFSLPSSYSFFESNIERLFIIPEHIFGTIPASNLRLSSYNLEPVSSGPYIFDNFQRRRDGFITQYHLTVNENYHGNIPYIEDFYFRFYEDENSLETAYRRRDVDGFGILTLPDDDTYGLPNVSVRQSPMPRYYAVFFNPKATSMLNEERFREALDLAIDKSSLVNEVLRGQGEVVSGPYGSQMIDEEYNGDNKERAETIINELKEENDSIEIEITAPNIEFIVQTAEFVKRQWEDVGVDRVIINPLKTEEFSSLVLRERNYESVIFGNIMETPKDLFPFWHSSERFYPGLNLSLYSNEDVDEKLETIRQTNDKSEINSEFREVINLITDSTPASFLYSLPYSYVFNEDLNGFSFRENGVVVPNDRFENVEEWHVRKARVIE